MLARWGAVRVAYDELRGLFERYIRGLARIACNTLEVIIMVDDVVAVRSALNVNLGAPRARLDGFIQSGNAVLGRLVAACTVGDYFDLRFWLEDLIKVLMSQYGYGYATHERNQPHKRKGNNAAFSGNSHYNLVVGGVGAVQHRKLKRKNR